MHSGQDHTTTPLLEIDLYGFPVAIKRESEQPSGSHKDRVARVKVAFLKEVFGLGSTLKNLLLSSSGNTARAFATHIADLPGVVLHVVTDELSPAKHRAELSKFGNVRLHVVDNPDDSGSHLTARLTRIEELKNHFRDAGENYYEIDQYGDPLFSIAHELSLAEEIEQQVDGPLAAILVPGGTCATLHGLSQFKKSNSRNWLLIPVDAEGSRLFDPNNTSGRRVYSGHGNARPTEFSKSCDQTAEPERPSNLAVARMARWLLIRHELYVGPSSAAVAAAFVALLNAQPYCLPHYGTVVLVMPDGGDNYSDTLHNDDWLMSQGLGLATGP